MDKYAYNGPVIIRVLSFCPGGIMDKYAYNGPVMIFDRCVASHWKAETMASSATKAKSNIIYQYKKQNNLVPGTKVVLPGEVRRIN